MGYSLPPAQERFALSFHSMAVLLSIWGAMIKDIPHPEKSLFWFALNADKKSITLNIETTDGRDLFRRLVRPPISSSSRLPPATMEGLGLGYKETGPMI